MDRNINVGPPLIEDWKPNFRMGAKEALMAYLTDEEAETILTEKIEADVEEATENYVPPVNRDKPTGVFITDNLVRAVDGVLARAHVYTQLHFNSKRYNHEVTTSYKHLAGELGLSKDQVRRAIEWLISEEWIMLWTNETEFGGHQSNTYSVTDKALQWLAPEKDKKHLCKRCETFFESYVPENTSSESMSAATEKEGKSESEPGDASPEDLKKLADKVKRY